MWEDTGAWNTYADNPIDYSGDYSGDWMNDPSLWSDSPQQFNDNWNAYQPADWAPQASTGGWQQNYDYSEPSTPSMGGMKNNEQYNFTPDPTSRYYPMQGNTSDEVANRFMEQSGGNPLAATGAATQWRSGQFENSPILRDASHDLLTRAVIADHPVLGRIAAPALSTGYSGAKLAIQNLPEWMQQYLPASYTQASPPSWPEVWAGTRAAFRR